MQLPSIEWPLPPQIQPNMGVAFRSFADLNAEGAEGNAESSTDIDMASDEEDSNGSDGSRTSSSEDDGSASGSDGSDDDDE